MNPTTLAAKSKMRWVMPRVFIRLAARMKNGTAISSKLWVDRAMICGMDRGSYPPAIIASITARPMAMETGSLSSMKTRNRTNSRTEIMPPSPPPRGPPATGPGIGEW